MIKHSRDSEWMVMRRCLAIVGRLLRGPATRTELIEAVRYVAGSDAYVENPETKRISALEQDLSRRLPERFGIVVRYERRENLYKLQEFPELPGFDLPDEALATIAFLTETFQPGSPQQENVGLLLQHIRSCLPEHRRLELEQQRVTLRVNLRQLGTRSIPTAVHRVIQRAIVQRRLLRFRYLPPKHEDNLPRTHTVEPYDLYFDSVWGHEYLYAFCRSTDGPYGVWEINRFIRYRPERILSQTIEVLETKLPPGQPKTRRYLLVYRLAAALARVGDVSQHFPKMEITPEEDGSVIVQAEVDDLFFALRTLLHYGSMCEVLGGPEALREMREIVHEMTKLYENS